MAGVRLGVSYKFLTVTVGSLFLLAACSEEAPQTTQVMESEAPMAAPVEPGLGINPRGKTELEIDMSRIHNPQLAEVFDYIDTNIDSHVEICSAGSSNLAYRILVRVFKNQPIW